MFIPVAGGQGISRPFVVGLILLLVFLGLQSDLVPSKPDSEGKPVADKKESAKERIILELSKSNEKLERELHQLQQQMLLAKHAAHQHGITHDSQLGSMLYAEDLDSILYSNTTAANSTVQALSQHNVNPEVPLMTDHTTTVDLPVSSRSSSRRELPTRTHHQAHQTAELP